MSSVNVALILEFTTCSNRWSIYKYQMTSQMREDEDESKRETSDSEFKLNQLELDKELLLHQERLQQLLDQGDSESFLEDPQLMQPLPAALAGKNQITLKP